MDSANVAEVKIVYKRLTFSNFGRWENNTLALLGTRRHRSFITAYSAYPPSDLTLVDAWNLGAFDTVGILWAMISDEICNNEEVWCYMREGKPFDMWAAICIEARQPSAGACFQAAQDLKIVLRDNEQLTEFYHRIINMSCRRKSLRPAVYTLQNFDDELDVFTFIRGLPEAYNSFVSRVFVGAGLALLSLPSLLKLIKLKDSHEQTRGGLVARALRTQVYRHLSPCAPGTDSWCPAGSQPQSPHAHIDAPSSSV